MDAIEQYVTDAIVKALNKSAPALSAADDAKVTKTVQDFVTTCTIMALVVQVVAAVFCSAAGPPWNQDIDLFAFCSVYTGPAGSGLVMMRSCLKIRHGVNDDVGGVLGDGPFPALGPLLPAAPHVGGRR